MTATSCDRISVCLVAYDSLPVFDSSVRRGFGGIETESVLIARELARDDRFDVSLMVRHTHRSQVAELDGVRIITRVEPFLRIREAVSSCVTITRNWPWVRIQKFNPGLLWQIPLLAATWPFRRRDPNPFAPDPFFVATEIDVFFCFGASSLTASIASSVSGQILCLASDTDIDARIGPQSDWVNDYGESGRACYHALTGANQIIAQTTRQQRQLKERFDLDSEVVSKLFNLEDWDRRLASPPTFAYPDDWESYVIWLGRADTFHKRPLLLLELAKRLNDIRFLVILNPSDLDVEREFRANCPENVRIIERVSFDELPDVYRRAAMYVSTSSSDFEGFPNVLVQAAATSIPIVSLEVDPGFVQEQGCGTVADGDMDRLAQSVRSCWDDRSLAQEYGKRGRQYVEANHREAVFVDRVASYILNVVAEKRTH